MSFLSSLFRNSRSFGLDVSDTSIQLLSVARTSGAQTKASSWLHMDIPEGLIEDGIILDQEGLAEVLRRVHADAKPHPPRTKRVVVGLPDTQTFIHHFSVAPNIKSEELENEIIRQVNASIPINLDDYAWDFKVISKHSHAYEVFFAAAPATVVEAYEQTFALAGLELVVLEPESLALATALGRPQALQPGKGMGIIDMGGRSTTIAFADQTGLRFSVTRPEAGAFITKQIVDKLKISKLAADQRKTQKGFKDKALAPLVESAVEPVIQEFQHAAAYYEQSTKQTLSHIVFCGGSSLLPGLTEFMQEKLGLPFKRPEPSVTADELEPERLVVAAGLATLAARDTSEINFIIPN